MRIRLKQAVLVEGKYDKIHLESILDTMILTCDGFGIFKQKEKAAMLRRIAQERGLLVLTDPDGGGALIRSHLRSILPRRGVEHLYVPAIAGKEKRKAAPSKAGLLGVEGIDADRLRALFAPFAVDADEMPSKAEAAMTKVELYEAGLVGGAGSAEKRRALCVRLELPPDLTANAMLEAINLLGLADWTRELLAAQDAVVQEMRKGEMDVESD